MSTNKSEQAVALAALILADESVPITPEKLQALLKVAGIEDVEPIWTTLFANALKDKNVDDILTTISTTEVGRGQSTEVKDNGGDGGKTGDDDIDGVDICDSDDSDDSDDYGTGYLLFD